MKLLATVLVGVVCWAVAILAFGDFVLWLMAASTALLVVIAVVLSVEDHYRQKTLVVPHGKKRVGLR